MFHKLLLSLEILVDIGMTGDPVLVEWPSFIYLRYFYALQTAGPSVYFKGLRTYDRL